MVKNVGNAPNARKDIENMDSSSITTGNVKCHSQCGKQSESFL